MALTSCKLLLCNGEALLVRGTLYLFVRWVLNDEKQTAKNHPVSQSLKLEMVLSWHTYV